MTSVPVEKMCRLAGRSRVWEFAVIYRAVVDRTKIVAFVTALEEHDDAFIIPQLTLQSRHHSDGVLPHSGTRVGVNDMITQLRPIGGSSDDDCILFTDCFCEKGFGEMRWECTGEEDPLEL